MALHYITIRKIAFNNIKNGKKTVEGRLLKGIFSNMKIGDEIIFVNNNDSIKKTISKINIYNSFLQHAP